MQELSNKVANATDNRDEPFADQELPEALAPDAGLPELRQELSKWQARVPKLAAALRQRTEQAQKLQAKLHAMAEANPEKVAHEGLSTEMQAKLGALNSRQQDLQGQVHSRDLEINALRRDVADWREKWQSASGELDEQATRAASLDALVQGAKDELAVVRGALQEREEVCADQEHELQMLRDESESLRKRNAQLFETTEFANRQLASLGDSLKSLRKQLEVKEAEVAELQARNSALTDQLAAGELQLEALEAAGGEATREIARLESCVHNAEQVTNELSDQRRELSAQVKLANERVAYLENQLDERSGLVVGLEQEKLAAERDARELRGESDRLDGQLERAERSATEYATHITQLDARLERQKELIATLEEEMVQKHQEAASEKKSLARELADKNRLIAQLRREPALSPAAQATTVLQETSAAPAQAASEVQVLRSEVQNLERTLRQRTEEINKLQWQQGMIKQVDAGATADDSKMLLVLNQQLSDARASNERLSSRVRELEAKAAEPPVSSLAVEASTDDLTRIRGIGPKVASQLHELGINCFTQLAELEPEALSDADHPLNPLKGRIAKDAWIEQARRLNLGSES
jgi:predicted flap endonuclease-1-like 5' DNA nuclease/predicted  nucleic acid-binding Zn-ribbon protein